MTKKVYLAVLVPQWISSGSTGGALIRFCREDLDYFNNELIPTFRRLLESNSSIMHIALLDPTAVFYESIYGLRDKLKENVWVVLDSKQYTHYCYKMEVQGNVFATVTEAGIYWTLCNEMTNTFVETEIIPFAVFGIDTEGFNTNETKRPRKKRTLCIR